MDAHCYNGDADDPNAYDERPESECQDCGYVFTSDADARLHQCPARCQECGEHVEQDGHRISCTRHQNFNEPADGGCYL